jgi:hypothetical protein
MRILGRIILALVVGAACGVAIVALWAILQKWLPLQSPIVQHPRMEVALLLFLGAIVLSVVILFAITAAIGRTLCGLNPRWAVVAALLAQATTIAVSNYSAYLLIWHKAISWQGIILTAASLGIIRFLPGDRTIDLVGGIIGIIIFITFTRGWQKRFEKRLGIYIAPEGESILPTTQPDRFSIIFWSCMALVFLLIFQDIVFSYAQIAKGLIALAWILTILRIAVITWIIPLGRGDAMHRIELLHKAIWIENFYIFALSAIMILALFAWQVIWLAIIIMIWLFVFCFWMLLSYSKLAQTVTTAGEQQVISIPAQYSPRQVMQIKQGAFLLGISLVAVLILLMARVINWHTALSALVIIIALFGNACGRIVGWRFGMDKVSQATK